MIPELGHYALVLALALGLMQSLVPLIGARRNDAALMGLADYTALMQFGFVALSFGALTACYVTSDFSVATVFENSHSMMPLVYKITSVWGNHEGSMLLWVLILSVFGAGVAAFGRNLPATLKALVLAVQSWIACAFYLFILLTSNPFLRLANPPFEGRDLNPILQDPGLAIHPPLLYLGYVGFSIAFSFAIAALIEGRIDAAWARWVRPWTLAAWMFLTLGIAMGSYWAYYTLGWGGFWFWDPVENASLMPWLAGTALLHSAVVMEKRNALKVWTILLAILTFSLSLVGTFLVRSGVLTSVHAFAVDPARGTYILVLLVLAIGGSLTLYAVRAPALAGGGLFAPISREGALVLNNVLLATAAATVFLGTLYPLFLDTIGGPKLSVGFPFFNRTFVPLMVPALLAVAVGPLLAWKRGDLGGALQRLWFAFAAALAVALVGLYIAGFKPILALLGLALATWVGSGVLCEWAERVKLFRAPAAETWRRARYLPRASYAMSLAHFGLAVSVAGIAASAFEVEQIQMLHPGDTLPIAGYALKFDGTEKIDGPNFSADRATIEVRRNGETIEVLHPERRFFPLQQMTTSVTAIRSNLLADLYVALGDPDQSNGSTIRAYWKPLTPWIWMGAVIMAIGGLLSLSDRRWRVGVAARRRLPAAHPAPGE
jgi:cytochrome c-type biogenesis protein CcmF